MVKKEPHLEIKLLTKFFTCFTLLCPEQILGWTPLIIQDVLLFLLNTEEANILIVLVDYIWVQYWFFPNTEDIYYFYLALSSVFLHLRA